MSHLIAAADLVRELDGDRPVRLLDVRWRLDSPEGRPGYLRGHLPGAVYVDLERELSGRGQPDDGRYPLPTVDLLQTSARRWGVDEGDLVVAYDDNDGVAAARAWWLLHSRGIDIRVLDGGIRGWFSDGLPLEAGDRAPSRGGVRLHDGDPGVATISDAARAPYHGHLVDVRAPEHYRGLVRGLDPASGHIPGAINIPTVAHIAQDGRLRGADEIRHTITAAGVTGAGTVVVYCGAGIASAHSALAFAEAGVQTRVFAGSWSQWSRSAGRPVAVGRTPGDAVQGML